MVVITLHTECAPCYGLPVWLMSHYPSYCIWPLRAFWLLHDPCSRTDPHIPFSVCVCVCVCVVCVCVHAYVCVHISFYMSCCSNLDTTRATILAVNLDHTHLSAMRPSIPGQCLEWELSYPSSSPERSCARTGVRCPSHLGGRDLGDREGGQ